MLQGPQEIPRDVWDPQVGYHVYTTSPLVRFLSQINSLHAIPVYFFVIHFSIILPCTPVYSTCFFTAGFRTKYLCVYLSPIKYVHIVISLWRRFPVFFQRTPLTTLLEVLTVIFTSVIIIRFVITVVFNKRIRVECMYLSNTTLFDGRNMYRIYYIRYSYMFRRLTMARYRLYMKYLVSSY